MHRMNRRSGTAILLLMPLIAMAVALSPAALAGQGAREALRTRVAALPGTATIRTFIASRLAKGFTTPKTPWGDPDISGNFDTSPEANTPMERPSEWAGRNMDDISPQEMVEAIKKRQQAAVEFAPFFGGGEPEEGVAIAVPIHWFDNLAAVNSRPWWVIDPPDGKIPPVTPDVSKRQAAAAAAQREARKTPNFRPGGTRDHYTERSATERCITFQTPWRTPIIYGNAHQIVQTPNYVVFRSEMIHEARIVPIDGRAHAGAAIRTHFGDSRGYWDGNSLVIETTNLHPDMSVTLSASGENLRVVERLTRISPTQVEWTVTFEDPKTWTRPWTYSYPMTVNDEKPIFEYACHEGNFGMANLLTAGRESEKSGSPRK